MSNNQSYENIEQEEVTLKEFIQTSRDYLSHYLSSWKLIVFLGLIGGAFSLLNIWFELPKYKATMTFMTNDNQGNNLGPLSGIISSFIPGAPGKEYSLDRIVELSKSKRIIHSAVLTKTNIKGKNDLLANHLIRYYRLHEEWEKDTTGLKEFLFIKDSVQNFNNTEYRAINRIYGLVKGDPDSDEESLLKTGYGKETSIMKMSINSVNDNLSVSLLNTIYHKLSEFYINKTIEKPLQTYKNIKAKTDSLKTELELTEEALASFKDYNRGLISASSKLNEKRMNRQLKLLTIAYGKALENLEIADFSLKNETPFFQVIDTPNLPIKPSRSSKLVALIFGGFLGGFLALTFLTLQKMIGEALA